MGISRFFVFGGGDGGVFDADATNNVKDLELFLRMLRHH